VHKLNRLAPDRADDVATLLDIRKASATLVSVSEQIDETPAGTLMHGIVASFAEFYSKNLSTEAKKGLEERVRLGATPGVAPIGYLNTTRRIDGTEVKSVIVDEHRAPHIQWAFAQYATGDSSISSLSDTLEERGLTRETLKYRGQPLSHSHSHSHSQAHRMLSQPYYNGQIRLKGMLFDGKHDALVDDVTWQQVQDILARRRLRRPLLAPWPLPQRQPGLRALRRQDWLRLIQRQRRQIRLLLLSRPSYPPHYLRPAVHACRCDRKENRQHLVAHPIHAKDVGWHRNSRHRRL
jgi:DNA invertase Pin-like site-specific DNA recombinase